ncbi:MAG: DUF3078 domain-containing protein [Candidatus Marinimicrobia bacterium]|nr:DUF3078 domain-containing protein [Candidatus Neomarinimicrobiota bacterium]
MWEKSVVGGLNLTQTSFDNWSAGGENAFSWQVNLTYQFVKNDARFSWKNTGKFAYGNARIGDTELIKSADEIKLESVYTYKTGTAVNPYAAVTGETQFTEGFDYTTEPATEISAFMDPGYFRESLGAGVQLNEVVTTRLGAALKQTVTHDYPGYSDDPDTPVEIETLRSEVGAESVTDINWPVTESAQYRGKLELFSNFGGLDEIDVNYDNILTVKVSEYINMNVNVKLVYDKDISVKRQIKQTMAIGLNYTFI